MADQDIPQLYLISPSDFDIDSFPNDFGRILDVVEVACARLSVAWSDEDRVARAADALRELCHARDVPLVIDRHVLMVERLGLDGVHLTDGARGVRTAREELGADPIVGAFCGASRHDGMTAGEAGADYVAFGPIRATTMGDGSFAESDLFAWWSAMIELPVVAEGALTVSDVETLAPMTDFFAIGDEIWAAEDPLAALTTLIAPLR